MKKIVRICSRTSYKCGGFTFGKLTVPAVDFCIKSRFVTVKSTLILFARNRNYDLVCTVIFLYKKCLCIFGNFCVITSESRLTPEKAVSEVCKIYGFLRKVIYIYNNGLIGREKVAVRCFRFNENRCHIREIGMCDFFCIAECTFCHRGCFYVHFRILSARRFGGIRIL